MPRDVNKHLVDYQSRYITQEYCGKCGVPLKSSDVYCPDCGLWLDVHEGAVITDSERAKKLRDDYLSDMH